MGGGWKEQMPHGLNKKRPAKKIQEERKKLFFVAVAAEPVQGRRAHGGKIETEKNQKRTERAALHRTNGSFVWWQ